MASPNIADSSPPSTPSLGASDEADPSPRINALLVALAALTHSFPGDVLDVLPHLSRHTPSSVCPASTTQRLPQCKLLDALASLIAFHPHCPAAAVALEATPNRIGLYISVTSTTDAAPPPATAASSPESELRAEVATWLGLVRHIARGRTQPKAKPETDDVDDADVMGLAHTRLTVAVFRACYGALRTRLRALPLRVLLRKFESCAISMAVVGLATMRTERDAHAEALERMGEHLEALLRLTDVEDAREIKDERHFVALHVAGRFAVRALRDEGFRVFLNGIDCETVEVVERASFLSRLVTTLVNTAKSSSTAGALALPWHIEWIPPAPTAAWFDATIDTQLLQEWLHSIAWEETPLLDRPTDTAAWSYSQIVGEVLLNAPYGLVRKTSSTLDGGEEHRYVLARTMPLV